MIPRMVRRGVSAGPRDRTGGLFIGARADDPALDPHDRVRGDRGDLGGRGVSLHDNSWDPADDRLCRPELPVPAEGEDDHGRGTGPRSRRRSQGRHDGRQGILGAAAAGLHPGQHLLRDRHADRGRRNRLRLHGHRGLRVLSGPHAAELPQGHRACCGHHRFNHRGAVLPVRHEPGDDSGTGAKGRGGRAGRAEREPHLRAPDDQT